MKLELPDFSQAQVLVIGDVMLDRYWAGPTSRISPEAPVPVVRVEDIEDRLGGAGNVALNISSLGSQCLLLGMVGADKEANVLRRLLDRIGIQCFLQEVASAHTVTKLRIMSRHQQLMRLDFEAGFPAGDEQLQQQYATAISQAGAVVLSDYGKGTLQDHFRLIQLAKEHNVPVVVDPKGNDFSIYHGATVVTPNMKEFEAVVGHCADEEALSRRAHNLIAEVGLQSVLITRGEQGMSLIQKDQPDIHLPTRALDVFDVTGAGDTVVAVLAAALAAKKSLPAAMALANVAAGVVVGKVGTASCSVPELRRACHQIESTGLGILTEKRLLEQVADARAHNETIVMTNGCFDILHPGHVAYLEDAKRHGDRLIVAVNDDASVNRLKGEERPVNNLQHRMQVLAGLSAVDWVVPFSEDTPERVIKAVRPDVLVKGGDWKIEDIVGSDFVLSHGGEVHSLPFVEGQSTTSIIEKIKPKQPEELA